MKINLNRLLDERNKRAWTQAHMAEVCCLSLRTIQRIEKSGIASQESIQSLASVLEIPLKLLLIDNNIELKVVNTIQNKKIKYSAILGWLLVSIIPFVIVIGELSGGSIKLNITANSEMMISSIWFYLLHYTTIFYYLPISAFLFFSYSIYANKHQPYFVYFGLFLASIMLFTKSIIVGFIILSSSLMMLVILAKFIHKSTNEIKGS